MKIQVNTSRRKNTINRNIYGHFSEHLGRCIYEGIFVGCGSEIPNTRGIRNDVANALRAIQVPVLRWPGGCFADEYHWEDGVGPREKRPRMVNTHWGGVVEDNSFGTHEFFDLCAQIGCEPYVNGNLGSGTVRQMSQWIEYMTFDGDSPMSRLRRENGRGQPWKLKYFGVGNENWGCGGNMRPEYYADEYRRYQTYCKNHSGNVLYKIACGSSGLDYDWTDVVMRLAGKYMDAITLHHYTLPTGVWSAKGAATGFSDDEYYSTIKNCKRMDELIGNHLQIMNRHDPAHRVGLIVDEWGTWYDVEPGTNPGFLYQQNTQRDAIVAALTLNIFNSYSERVVMANIAQTVNVLQAVILTDGEKMLTTPTYHVFDLMKVHQDATLVDSAVIDSPQDPAGESISVSASTTDDGLHITLVNTSLAGAIDVFCEVTGMDVRSVKARGLFSQVTAHNTFDSPNTVQITDTTAQPTPGGFTYAAPPGSVTQFFIAR